MSSSTFFEDAFPSWEYLKPAPTKSTEPSATRVTGFSGSFISLSSSRISTILSPEAFAIVIMAKIMEIIIRLIKICMVYVIMLISCPVVRPAAASFPPAIIILAPIQEIRSIHVYMHPCIRGITKDIVFSALEKSLYMFPETFPNFSFS